MKAFVLGIAGGTGSGKTTIVRRLERRLGNDQIVVLEHDSYYAPPPGLSLEERRLVNYDHPDSLETSLLIEHLLDLREFRPVDIPTYDFNLHQRRAEVRRIQPRPIIIVEGILVLAEKALRNCFDLSIFVSTDDDLRLARRLERDRSERGRTTESVIRQYLTTVKPMHERFVGPSQKHADLIVQGCREFDRAVDVLAARLSTFLSEGKSRVVSERVDP